MDNRALSATPYAIGHACRHTVADAARGLRRLRAPLAGRSRCGRRIHRTGRRRRRSLRARTPRRPLHGVGVAGQHGWHAHPAHPPPQARPLAAAGRACRRRSRPCGLGAARSLRGNRAERVDGGAGHLRPRPALDPGAHRRARALAPRRALRRAGGYRRELRGQRGVACACMATDRSRCDRQRGRPSLRRMARKWLARKERKRYRSRRDAAGWTRVQGRVPARSRTNFSPQPTVLVVSRFSRGGRLSSPCTRNHTFSAMLVAWSPMRSRFLAMNSRCVHGVIERASSIM